MTHRVVYTLSREVMLPSAGRVHRLRAVPGTGIYWGTSSGQGYPYGIWRGVLLHRPGAVLPPHRPGAVYRLLPGVCP